MTGRLSKSVAADGVIAYQDREDPRKFHYMPARIDAVLGETIQQFDVQYYGIGGKANWVKAGDEWLDISGGVVTGQFTPDITAIQREAILKEIVEAYKVEDPFLTPLLLHDSQVTPVFAKSVQEIGGGGSTDWSETFQYGSSLNFSIDSGNSLFPQLLARSTPGEQTVGSDIGINFSGKTQLYGEPWKAKITADLSQVWSYVRDQVDSGVSVGWFNLGTAYDQIAQELVKENIIQIEYIEGTGGEEFGRQLLESTKIVFEAINNQIVAGEGMFRFEPNPDPQDPPKHEGSWGASLLPFQVNVNMSFARNSFKQSISFEQEVSFEGLIEIDVNSSMNLAVLCGSQTSHLYYDATLGVYECISTTKINAFFERANKEIAAKNEEIEELWNLFLKGQLTFTEYQESVAMLNNRVLTEGTLDGVNILSKEQAIAIFEEKVRKTLGISLDSLRSREKVKS